MLDLLRKNTGSFIIYLLFAIIIVVFMFTFGAITPDQACGGAQQAGQVGDLAVVDGVPISGSVFQLADSLSISPPSPKNRDQRAQEKRQYYNAFRYGLAQYGTDDNQQQRWFYTPIIDTPFREFGPDPEEVSPLKVQKILDNLIETRLVAGQARKMGMSVTTEELSKNLYYLSQQFVNPETGEFDRGAWDGYVRGFGTTPSGFEAFISDEILRARMIQLLVGSMSVSADELDFQHKAQNEKVKLAYVSIDKVSAKPLVKLEDKEVQDWLVANQAKVDKYYEDNKAKEFTKPKRFKLRGIKLDAPNPGSLAADTTPEQKAELEKQRAEVKAKAELALADLKAKLGTAAPKDENEDKPADDNDKPATDGDKPAADGDKPAADGDKPAADGDKPAADGDKPAVDGAAVFAEVAKASSDHDSKAAGGLLDKAYSDVELGRYPFGPTVKAAVTALKAGDHTGVVEVDSGFWILRVEQIFEPVTTSLADAQNGITRSLLADERVADFKTKLADEVLAEAKTDATKSLEDVVKVINARYGITDGGGLQARTTQPFPRLSGLSVGYIFGIGKSPELLRAAFAATEEAPLLDKVFTIDPGDKHVIARFLEREAAPEQDLQAQKTLAERLNRERQNRFYRAWYNDLLDKQTREGKIELTEVWKATLSNAVSAYQAAGGVLQTKTAAAPVVTPTAEAKN